MINYIISIKTLYMIYEDIKEEIKSAMRSKDVLRLSVLRNILSAFTNELVATGKTPQDALGDEEALAVIKRLAKQRKDSITQFEKGGRQDLAKEEREELAVLEQYLPQMMGKEDIRNIVEAKKAELGIEDKAKMGMLMGAVMKETAGRADGNSVKAVVEELL
ncbi:MAG: GatB/YqeY domain-containing protein [Patescibacteria group bacterium]|nr:MAG: GatB/YqeY domain-containing protein [Patescibacteria group bacterium]